MHYLTQSGLITLLGYIELGSCSAALCLILLKKQWKDFWALGLFLSLRVGSNLVFACIWYLGGRHIIGVRAAYEVYWYVYWIVFAVESVLTLLIVYGLFRLAMAPLKGLQALGMLVFRWAAGMSIAVALGGALKPQTSGIGYLMEVVSQLQRTDAILTLCLLLFVCFAIRPMGLSYGSRIFGISLGLGIMSTNDFVQSAWLAFNPNMTTKYNLINGIVSCGFIATWAAYFALPEPRRRLIVLPTTSPFLRWNQISQALGDSPGFVAVGGIPPDLFAPAELEVMRRASNKMVASFPAQSAPAMHEDERMLSSAAV